MQINVAVTDANNIVCQVTPPAVQTITIDRGVEGNGIVSIVPVTIGSLQYLRITYTDGTVSDVGPITSTAYTGTSPIDITGNVISLLTVPISLGGTGQTTANASLNALLPSQTGNASKYLQTDGTNASWDAISLSTADITGILPTANGGTGLSAFAANQVFYASSTNAIGQSANLTFNGTTLSAAGLSDSGNLTFTGTGNRILGDFTNATVANRVSFQSSTTNGGTFVQALPNGTSQFAKFQTWNNSSTTNAQYLDVGVDSSYAYLQSVATGSAVPLPMVIGPNGSGLYISSTPTSRVGVNTQNPVSEGANARLAVLGDAGQGATSALTSLNAQAVMTVRGDASSGFVLNLGSLASDGSPYLQATSLSGGAISSTLNLQTGGGNIRLGGSGTSTRITGDFGSGAVNTRIFFQSSSSNTQTNIVAVENGTVPNANGAAQLVVADSAYATGANFVSGSIALLKNTAVAISSNASGTGTALPMTFQTGGSERMRIDTFGNVGIGTSSPITTSARLSVRPAGDYDAGLAIGSNASAANWARLDFKNTNAASPAILYQQQSGQFNIRTDGAYPIAFETNGGNERMRIDSSGRVFVGTTAQIGTSAAAVQVLQATNPAISIGVSTTPAAAAVSYGGIDAWAFDGAAYVAGGTINFRAAEAWSTTNHGSDIQFRTTASGSGGALFEAMRITSAGNVGIGTTNANPIAAGRNLAINSASGTAAWSLSSAGTLGLFAYTDGTSGAISVFPAGPLQFLTNNTERMRIDSSGNVGIGTTTPRGCFDAIGGGTSAQRNWAYVAGGNVGGQNPVAGFGGGVAFGTNFSSGNSETNLVWGQTVGAQQYLSFSKWTGTSVVEQMRIDSFGNLMVGTTGPAGRFTASAIGNGTAGYFFSSGGTAVIAAVDAGVNGANIGFFGNGTNPNKYIRAQGGNLEVINSAYSAAIMYVTNAGAAFQGNNSSTWSTTSDIRIKTNVRQIGSALDKMMALKPCHFEYKNAVGETVTGFIAQEFEEVLPGHVKEQDAPMQFEQFIDGDDKKIKTIDANLVPYLVKAIQEQQAIITALTTRVEALESN